MNTNLFVGGISFRMDDEALKKAFEEAGTVVSAKIIMDKVTGRSRGFGFVEMGSAEEAEAAIKMFDGQELEGRRIAVKPAQPRE